jgi:site-specific DNA recombinase
MDTTNYNVIVLARVSTLDQEDAGNSLPAQMNRCLAYCDNNNLIVSEKLEFSESAWKANRIRFKKIVKNIQRHKETKTVLVCDKVDRLTRGFSYELLALEALRKVGKVELHFPHDNLVLNNTSPATDLFRYNMYVNLADYYSNTVSDNTKRAFELIRKNGRWIHMAPLGYKNITNIDESKDVVVDPEKSIIVANLFKDYSTGDFSIKSLEKKYNISKTSVNKILNNTFYYGIAKSKYGSYIHTHGEIITENLFNKCQSLLKGRIVRPTKVYNTKHFIFKSLCTCNRCNNVMDAYIAKKKYTYYRCNNNQCLNYQKTVNEVVLLKTLHRTFKKMKPSQEYKDFVVNTLQSQIEEDKKQAKMHKQKLMKKEIENLETLDLLLNNLLKENITGDIYKEKSHKIKMENLSIKENITRLDGAILEIHKKALDAYDLLDNVEKIFKSSKTPQKNKILKLLLSNFVCLGDKPHIYLKKPWSIFVKNRGKSQWLRSVGLLRTYFTTTDSDYVPDSHSLKNIFQEI